MKNLPALIALHALLLAGWMPAVTPAPNATADPDWVVAAEILKRVQAPVFPARDFPITSYGAVAGGEQPATAAIRAAIAACHADGGGRVVVPAGVFLTGAIHLLSNVNLHLEKGATLNFSTDPGDYLPVVFTRWDGLEAMNYSPFIYAFGQENIAVTGEGTLDGQAGPANWWGWNDKRDNLRKEVVSAGRLNQLGEAGVPVAERIFGPGSHLRPVFIQPYRCRNVLIEGVRIRRSPKWEINPVLCVNVTVRGVDIMSHGLNNDGCNPESCRDVLIENCRFDTGDDCIAIKSGKNNDGRRVGVPAENIVIRNCEMKAGHGGVVIGSEISGGARNIFIEDCRMDSPKLMRALRFKNNSRRGGLVENIFLRNVRVGEVAHAVIQVDFDYDEGDGGDFTPVVRHIVVENVTCVSAAHVLFLQGYERSPVRDITLRNCRFDGIRQADVLRHVRGLVLDNCSVNASTPTDKYGAPLKADRPTPAPK